MIRPAARSLGVGCLCLCFVGAVHPASARAQVVDELSDPASEAVVEQASTGPRRADPILLARMEEQLEGRASSERSSGLVTGITSLSIGALLLGSSIWFSADGDAFGLGFGTPNLAALTGFMVSPMMIATGLYTLLAIRPNGDRLARWREAMSGELSDVELGRFEGELRAEANAARVSRWGGFALGIGLLAGGATTMILGGALDGFDDELRAIVVGTGGGLLAIGAVVTGTSFLESSVEQMWNEYRGGRSGSRGPTVQVALGLGGLQITGTF